VVDVLLDGVFEVAETLLARKVQLLLVEEPGDGVVVRVELGLAVEQQRFTGQPVRVSVRVESIRRGNGIDGGHVRSLSLLV
jgi:hypothetical protein